MKYRHFNVKSTPCWLVLSAAAGIGLLIAGAMRSGLDGLLLSMAAVVPVGIAAANVSLVAGLRDALKDCWRSSHDKRSHDSGAGGFQRGVARRDPARARSGAHVP